MKMNKAACFLRVLFAAVLFAAVSAVGQDGEGGYDAPYFQADFTQDLNSWTSTLVNPALTPRVNQMHAAMAFYRWGLDRGNMGYQDFTLLYPYRLRHTIGLTVLHSNNSMESVKLGDDGNPDFNGGTVSYQDLWLIGNYGMKVLPWLSVGGNLKLRTQAQFGENAFSKIPGVDVGVYITPFDHYHWGEIGISLMAQDLIPTQTPWEFGAIGDFQSPTGTADLITVSRGRMGLRYSGLNDNLVVSGELIIDNALGFIHQLSDGFKESYGAVYDVDENGNSIVRVPSWSEIKKNFPMALRWGFHAKYMFIPQIWFKGGWTNNNIPYLGFNYNFIYPLPEMINYLNVDYNFGYSFIDNSASMNDERGLVMMLRLAADFGRTREQKESRRMYDKLVVAPMDAYQEAMRLYVAGRHWEAAFAFGKLISLYPTFYLNDKAIYYMGDCYKHLYMNVTAREVFMEALDEYTTSDMRAHYLYGIMSLDYREGNYDEAMRNHAFITNLYAESEIVGEAEYLAGEIAFLHGDLETAKKHLELVKPTDPSYLYAQYTLAVVNHETDRVQAAIQNLRIVIDDTTSAVADKKLQNAAAVKLGHIYFEMGDKLRDAAESYSIVPENASPYGDEALLGMAWAWIKAGQPQLAVQRIDRILAYHPKSPFVPEAYLLRGYVLMLQRRYADAIPALERAIALAENNEFVTDEHVTQRKVQFDRVTEEFTPTAERIKRNAFRKPTPRSVEERTELQQGYEVFAKENKEFFEYRVLAKSHKNFFMQKEQIVEDATFALAKATNFMKTRGTASTIESMREATQQLDDEIERLRKELEEAGSGE